MKSKLPYSIALLSAGIIFGAAAAQEPSLAPQGAENTPQNSLHEMAPPTAPITLGAVPLEWTPPALAELDTQAAMKSSFMLDRSMLQAAAGLVPDS